MVSDGPGLAVRAGMPLHSIWTVLLLIAGAYAALVLVLFLFQSRLLYLPHIPSRAILATPEEVGLAYERVTITTEDGVALDGWFVPAPARRGTLLFFHGNAGNISHRLDSLKIFYDLGLATLIIDYRGYGRSTGEPSEEGTYRDAEAAWRYLTGARQIPARDIALFGRSLGAAVAAHLATRHAPGALILESAFTSVPDLAAELYPFLPARWLARFRYPTAADLRSVSCPVLIVHSRNDEIIPFAHAQRLFAAAREPRRLLEIRGGHNDGFLVSRPTYVEGLDAFLKVSLGRCSPCRPGGDEIP
ncbi:MAG: alpha/beta hydrolase [candidate division NC10 bacterium]|nr:alpha/beta hydrolase [candidate division NC10 bacterium]